MPTVMTLDQVAHEQFCLPRPDQKEPRMEGFVVYKDDESGRSRPSSFCSRCLECGAATYRPITSV